MGLRNKSLPLLVLSMMLMTGCGLTSNNAVVEEGAFDNFNNSPKYQLKEMAQIGQDETLSYSKIFAQYGHDESSYWIRFATAIKGNVSKISYVRDAVEERGETESVEEEVTTVYKAVSSEGVATYYNAETGLSTNEEDAGNYYWACYSIKIANVKYYSSTISMSFKIDDEVVATRKVSLNSLLGNENIYRFEAENAKIEGNSGNTTIKDQGHTCFETSTYVSSKFSGGICVRNNYFFNSTYDFTSSVKDDFAKLKLFMNTTGATQLSKLLSITINGNVLDLSSITVPATGDEYVSGNSYFKMCEVYVPVSLVSGENSIVISHGSSNATANVDYIEVITYSEVSNWVDTPLINSEDVEVELEQSPTYSTAGKVKVTCTHEELGESHGSTTYNLPTLADTDFYKETRDEENSLINYEFAISNKTFNFSYKTEYTLSLHGATFEDGSSSKSFTLQEISAGEANKVTYTAPEGKKLVGWYNRLTKEFVESTTFTMGYMDTDLEAVFKPITYVKSGSGYLDFADGVGSVSGYADGLSNVTFKNGNAVDKRVTSYAGNGEYGTIFELNVTKANGQFRAKTQYDVQPGSYEQTYFVYNFSSESVTLTLTQYNGSKETNTNAKPSTTVTIESGSYTTVVMEYTFNVDNTHSLTYFKFAKVMNDVKLGVTSSIKVK